MKIIKRYFKEKLKSDSVFKSLRQKKKNVLW